MPWHRISFLLFLFQNPSQIWYSHAQRKNHTSRKLLIWDEMFFSCQFLICLFLDCFWLVVRNFIKSLRGKILVIVLLSYPLISSIRFWQLLETNAILCNTSNNIYVLFDCRFERLRWKLRKTIWREYETTWVVIIKSRVMIAWSGTNRIIGINLEGLHYTVIRRFFDI